ncbi:MULTISPECIES: glucose-6-phosphate isomerase [Tsukamurella]|uniref:Glucose-6-phosphate isomerase n=2 Tax=Tsukamurella TaxID=2060 RepID=A0A5C5S6F2_9ACTN|nr:MULTISPECIES: glucose-6-phosphate isomerase [Tsukamurella]NMD55022.1 glucose-6-phosphate isomerase [Tsukamurella columbiensis]TWS30055.1 glucose-6-phosphate isomerase [Tsukamurella conjunctivitidis]
MSDSDITASTAWRNLVDHHRAIADTSLRELFAADPQRGSELVFRVGDLYIDYSKHRVTRETLGLLAALADEAGVAARRDAMLAGEHINATEDRAVLHTALRAPSSRDLRVDGQDVTGDVHDVLEKMGAFSEEVRSRRWRGATGEPITDVVNIGIGGSDLGPAMVYKALRAYVQRGITCHFVSNVDPADVTATLAHLNPATTLFIVASKTFGTQETLTNAHAAKRWLLDGLGTGEEAVAKHFVAVSTNADRVAAFGIDTANMFGFWDWVGGRYSVDSAIGLSVMIAVGPERFGEFLAGFRAVDEHFASAPVAENAPIMLGLIGLWYSDFFGAQSRAVLPYAQDLARFPAYLQQLTMESNGKSVRIDGTPVTADTGEIFWGEPGTNGQHAFFQLLHQGTRLVPADFLGFAESTDDLPTTDGVGTMQDLLMSNLFAQTKVLAFGKTADEIAAEGTDPKVVPHKVMPGDRPTTTILAPKLTPSVVGQLIALYEHQVFTEAAVWGINAFDQWGVELGKVQAGELLPVIADAAAPTADLDSSTDAQVRWYRTQRGRAV